MDNREKPMPLLLIEDDVAECLRFKDCANSRGDIVFVGMTGSSAEGLRLCRTHLPEGVILDLELHKGQGSGLLFLKEIKDAALPLLPLIVVTTNSPSPIVYNHVHDMGVDMVFYKRQTDYSADMVVGTLLALRKSLHAAVKGAPNDVRTTENPEQLRARVVSRIERELDLIGVNLKYKGRAYLQEAVLLLLSRDKANSEMTIATVAENQKCTYGSVLRAMQTVINNAWKNTPIEDLQAHYTARISAKTGVPSPTDFIRFYADKIRKSM